MKKIILLILTLASTVQVWSQNEDASGAITLNAVLLRNATSLVATGCDPAVRSLGTSTSPQAPASTSGTMANDVWFQFTAGAEVAKIKVCSPTTFDAAIEVWNAAATGTAIASANVGGSGAKEFLCVSGLTVGTNYKVRVGRVSGSGAGTFTISYEHLGVEVRDNYYPDPPGAATCYDFTTALQRSLITFPVGSTRWKFIDELGTLYGPFTLSYSITLEQTPGICEGHTYQVYCEVFATDAECGGIWWGYSAPRSIETCPSVCPSITLSSGTCGSTFCNIFNTDFTASYMGTGFQYQFKFVTDNGTTQFTSAWSNSPVFSSSQAPYVNYFRYNKIYEVYVRAKKCNANPSWCGPCVVTSCSQPYSFVNANCCRWRNKSSGGNITAQATVGNSNQYRFRFAPISINPCLAYPFTPIGIPVTTGWTSNAFVNPGSLPLTLGMVYNVQVQTRVLSATITNPNGTTTVVPGQTTDWGPNCMIGIRGSGSPAVGTALGCYCTPGMISEDDIFVYEEYRDLTFDSELNVPSIVTSIHENNIILDPSDAGLVGNGVLNIFNLSGQLVHSENMYSMENGNYIEIPIVEQLPSGIYLINIQSDSGSLTDKIYIQHE